MSQLSIIIPFLNEGAEVANTVDSIRRTTTTKIKIILINDGSDDGVDYKAIADKYACSYVYHISRMGVAASRDEGVALSVTPYFLLLDAHMRFYQRGWDKILIERLQENPRSLICSQTKVLKCQNDGDVYEATEHNHSWAGYINFDEPDMLCVKWNRVDLEPFSTLMEIPCILGAAYACAKDYWLRLNGVSGLITYGGDEELLSMKVWLEGGRCLLAKDWVVGHLYKDSFTYSVPKVDIIYNRMYIAELLLPYPVKSRVFHEIKMVKRDAFYRAYELLKKYYPAIKQERDYLKSIFSHPIDYYIKINRTVVEVNAEHVHKQDLHSGYFDSEKNTEHHRKTTLISST